MKKMKIVDETVEIDNKRIKREILESVELIEDLLIMANDLKDDYTKYRLKKHVIKLKCLTKK